MYRYLLIINFYVQTNKIIKRNNLSLFKYSNLYCNFAKFLNYKVMLNICEKKNVFNHNIHKKRKKITFVDFFYYALYCFLSVTLMLFPFPQR